MELLTKYQLRVKYGKINKNGWLVMDMQIRLHMVTIEDLVHQCIAAGLASGRLVGTDSTHVKACASRASEELVEMPVEPGVYWERLDACEEDALERLAEKLGHRRKKRTKQIKKDSRRSHRRVSHTDPESGHMKRPGKPEGPHYLTHQTVDTDHGIVLDVTVTPGDVNDSAPYLKQLERIHQKILRIQAATADAAYDFPLAHQVLADAGIKFCVRPQAVHPTTKVEFGRERFRYDGNNDCYVCPNGKSLNLHGVGRSASAVTWIYQAKCAGCQSCPDRDRCLSESHRKGGRKLERSVFHEVVQRDLKRREEPDYRDALRLRQIWCEGTFAAQKWGHNLARVLRRGLEAAEDHCLLSATALNLKRMIKCIG